MVFQCFSIIQHIELDPESRTLVILYMGVLLIAWRSGWGKSSWRVPEIQDNEAGVRLGCMHFILNFRLKTIAPLFLENMFVDFPRGPAPGED